MLPFRLICATVELWNNYCLPFQTPALSLNLLTILKKNKKRHECKNLWRSGLYFSKHIWLIIWFFCNRQLILSSVLVLPYTNIVNTTSYGMYIIIGYLVNREKYKKKKNISFSQHGEIASQMNGNWCAKILNNKMLTDTSMYSNCVLWRIEKT